MAKNARRPRRAHRWAVRAGALTGAAALTVLGAAGPSLASGHDYGGTATPIKHVVVIFGENISFDHYFATYPKAANTDGTPFKASKHTPKDIDTLAHAGLLTKNPNQYQPKRLSQEQAVTCDQNHSYTPEQYAYNGGKADKFVENTDSGKCSGNLFGEPGLVMDYYDGNTVTAWWNYAQHYSLNDRSFSDVYGPSSPGAISVVSGQTHGIISTDPASGSENPKQTDKPDPYTVVSPDAKGVGTMINDPDPAYDDCSGSDHTSKNALGAMQGKNIGDLLSQKHVSWGWFQGGFKPGTAWDGQQGHYAKCASVTHTNVGGAAVEDYSPHHEPFQYYKSTANPHHLPPKSVKEIGHDGQANHQYDLTDFDAALKTGNLPSVSYLKAASYQDGHAGYSDPVDEQHFLVDTINKVQKSSQWKDTAIVLAYDDSDGWYDHVMAKVKNGSKDTAPDSHGNPTDSPACQAGPAAAGGYADRCGPGPRQPLIVVSPYSKVNAVDHTPTQQASVVKFIEDNWHIGRIGDSSFDKDAGSLNGMFDFRHPNNQQVLLNSDGSVKSVGRIPHHVATASEKAVDAAQYTGGEIALSANGSDGTPSYAVAGAAAVVALVGAGAGVAVLRRRRAHAGSAH
ncbi:phospholipase C [Streptomyces sulfonofaciens]|uniref:Phospholipase C n=1 Tax=Streptomyces sulfonofaciens TaxID=68272 RepID=A0A919L609_9ACTN|nr:alkaline phosphatase family protein [Streptomyces sulfonofaciens]GHH84744.1 phospholipase C [Streptomyces sulfonofaciens]